MRKFNYLEMPLLRRLFETFHSGRRLEKHHLRGTYASPPIAALWNQHVRTAEWVIDYLELQYQIEQVQAVLCYKKQHSESSVDPVLMLTSMAFEKASDSIDRLFCESVAAFMKTDEWKQFKQNPQETQIELVFEKLKPAKTGETL